MSRIGLLNEKPLHAALKAWYAQPGDRFEVPLHGFVIDIVRDDVLLEVTVRGEPHTVIQALDRQMTHHAYHVGQIVFLCKHLRSAAWKTLSMPRRRHQ